MPFRYLFVRWGMIGVIPDWDLRGMELLLGVFTAGWGVQTLASDALRSNVAYVPFVELAPPWLWGATMLLTGLSQVVACLWHLPPVTRYASLGGVFIWAFTVAALWHMNSRLPSLPGYAALGVACFWLHLRGR